MVGCSNNYRFNYNYIQRSTLKKRFNYKVAVRPFIDKRVVKEKRFSMLDVLFLSPYIISETGHPEYGIDSESGDVAIRRYNMHPSTDFARALVSDLKTTGLFKDVIYSDNETFENDVDMILDAVIYSTDFKLTSFFYCVSISATLLWIIGLPTGRVDNELSININMLDKKTKEVILNKTYKKATSWYMGVYYSLDNYYKGYPQLLNEINSDLIKSIETELDDYIVNRSVH